MLTILNDPIKLLLQAATDLWPDLNVEILLRSDLSEKTLSIRPWEEVPLDIRDKIRGELPITEPDPTEVEVSAAGVTFFFEDQQHPARIELDPNQSVVEFLETLAEELVHAKMGLQEQHGPEFEAGLEMLQEAYAKLADALEVPPFLLQEETLKEGVAAQSICGFYRSERFRLE